MTLVYPQCKSKKGIEKVKCLIRCIKNDYRKGRISKQLAIARLRFLIFLSKKWRKKWGLSRQNILHIESLVDKAIRSIERAKKKSKKRRRRK